MWLVRWWRNFFFVFCFFVFFLTTQVTQPKNKTQLITTKEVMDDEQMFLYNVILQYIIALMLGIVHTVFVVYWAHICQEKEEKSQSVNSKNLPKVGCFFSFFFCLCICVCVCVCVCVFCVHCPFPTCANKNYIFFFYYLSDNEYTGWI